MSNTDTAEELISKIYNTEYSQEYFDWAVKYRDSVDDNLVKQTYKEVLQYEKQLLIKYNVISKYDDYATFLNKLKKQDVSLVKKFTAQEIQEMLNGKLRQFCQGNMTKVSFLRREYN
jgi:ABC-type uncharacterized transport system YnjBCD substrate-binding protein